MGVTSATILVTGLVFVSVAIRGRGRRTVRHRLGNRSPQPHGSRPLTMLAALGRCIGGRFGLEAADEILVGVSVFVVLAVAVSMGTISAVAALAAVGLVLRTRRRSRIHAREREIERGLPEVIDLFGLVIGAGRPAVVALSDIAPRTPEPFRSELTGVVRRAGAGEPFVESISRLRNQLGSSVTSLVYAVVAAEMDGVPLRPALERVADEAHRRRRVRAEEAARRVPVLMLFPLVFCILPAFCLLTIVPLLVGSIADLQLPG